MRRRIFVNTLVIAAVVLLILGLTGAVAADFWYTGLMVSELKKDCMVTAGEITPATSLPGLAVSASERLSMRNNNVRVTIIDGKGVVLGDSSADWHTMESHSDRPEFIRALKNGWGESQRYSNTLKVNMLYVAAYDAQRGVVVRAAMPLYEVQKIYWAFAGFVLACLAVSLAVAAVMAGRMSKHLSEPIESLTRMTGQIATGNYSIGSLHTRYPEFQELSDGLITLASDLGKHVSALENSNTQLTTVLASISEGLIAMDGGSRLLFVNAAACSMLGLENTHDVIGRKVSAAIPVKAVSDLSDECLHGQRTITTEITLSSGGLLLQASASPIRPPASGCILLLMDVTQLRKLENMRRDFVANVTHELRTPLTSIRGYVETLQAGALANPELSAKFLQIIEIESERLSNLISDLLYLSEIENSSQDMGIRHFHLADIANGVTEMLEYTASVRKISISSTIGNDIILEANPDRIKQLLLNLADNAVKYNVEGGSVVLSAEKTHALVRISVKDTGIGISEEHVSRIFERFYRVDKGRSRSMGGTGLGLSIVKHIVDLYRGNIRLISEAGKGSEFIIELPLKFESKKKS